MRMTRMIITALLICSGCLNTQAQDLKDILSGVLDKVTEYAESEKSDIVGTWIYESPECKFESDNLLAKAGASLASSKVTKKLEGLYSKIGMDSLRITFNADSTYTTVSKKRTVTGTYSYDEKEKTVTLKPKLGSAVNMHTSITSKSLSLMFESTKLMEGIKTIANIASKTNTTASLINSLIGNYDGMKIGFKMRKE